MSARITDEPLVIRLLAARKTIAQVERETGWPAVAIHRLAHRRRWLIVDGRVRIPPSQLPSPLKPEPEPGPLPVYRPRRRRPEGPERPGRLDLLTPDGDPDEDHYQQGRPD